MKDRNLIFECNKHNWGLHTSFDWQTINYKVFSDGTIEKIDYYGDSNNPLHNQIQNKKMNSSELSEFLNIINDLDDDTEEIDACDGETWDMAKYNDDHNIVWKKDVGYIYGNQKLEQIVNIITN